ncbi:MAG: hypothetical protein JW727_02595 [Candidatus Aenigmarchaeota archaeon]|nr:hypothetical protein [Candidatus Aenigmarchaeota archaeon]
MSGKLLNKKGIIRVFEMVLFSFLLFAILLPSFFKYEDVNDWTAAKNVILSQDLLFAFEKNKLLDDVLITDPITDGHSILAEHDADIELLENTTLSIFPVIYDFEYEVKNVAPPRVSIGCICSEEEEDWLKSKILTPSYPTFEFAIKRIALANLSESFDTFVIFGNQGLESYRGNITEMLSKGKGFVLIANFTSSPDSMTEEMFGISYTGGSSGTRSMKFENLSKEITSGISKRYVNNIVRVQTEGTNLTGKLYIQDTEFDLEQNVAAECVTISSCPDCLHEGESCQITPIVNLTLFQIDPLEQKWMDIYIRSYKDNQRDYSFEDLVPLAVEKTESTVLSWQDNSFANAVVGEYSLFYETEPRMFWIYGYDRKKDDLNLLLKTGIIWSSGEHYFVFNKPIPSKRNIAMHFYTGLRESQIPFTVKLYTWGY